MQNGDQLSLPLGLRVRRSLTPRPRSVLGYNGEGIADYTVQSERSGARVHCLVRYTGNMVARIVVQYPKGAVAEARRLRDALRQTFPEDRVNLHEVTGT
jgi:GrpB-like predicted nucleotidyltransferase (UPF0157 family)